MEDLGRSTGKIQYNIWNYAFIGLYSNENMNIWVFVTLGAFCIYQQVPQRRNQTEQASFAWHKGYLFGCTLLSLHQKSLNPTYWSVSEVQHDVHPEMEIFLNNVVRCFKDF